MSGPRHWAVVPAAGVGRRMGAGRPKQYLPLAGRPVIEHGLARLLAHPRIAGVCVALGAGDPWWPETAYANHPRLFTVTGGAERRDSVANALAVLARRGDPGDWVLVHDAARPCLRPGDLDRLMGALEGHPVGGLLGVPVHDTMKRTDPDGEVIATVAREHLWHAFTPQMFRLAPLQRALGEAIHAGVPVTDEASAMEWAGARPLMVAGHPDNIKITRPEDLPLAEFYLQRQAAGSAPD